MATASLQVVHFSNSRRSQSLNVICPFSWFLAGWLATWGINSMYGKMPHHCCVWHICLYVFLRCTAFLFLSFLFFSFFAFAFSAVISSNTFKHTLPLPSRGWVKLPSSPRMNVYTNHSECIIGLWFELSDQGWLWPFPEASTALAISLTLGFPFLS